MTLEETLVEITSTLELIRIFRDKFKLRGGKPQEPFLYTGIIQSDIVDAIGVEVENFFGPPYKQRNASAFFGNWFDPFIRRVGGIRKEQTLYRKEFEHGLALYCAFWPWGSNPIKTSVRLGLLLPADMDPATLTDALQGKFV